MAVETKKHTPQKTLKRNHRTAEHPRPGLTSSTQGETPSLALLQPRHMRVYDGAVEKASTSLHLPASGRPHSSAFTTGQRLSNGPPPLSARCQVHPSVMDELRMSPGDPVIVLALAEGWASADVIGAGRSSGRDEATLSAVVDSGPSLSPSAMDDDENNISTSNNDHAMVDESSSDVVVDGNPVVTRSRRAIAASTTVRSDRDYGYNDGLGESMCGVVKKIVDAEIDGGKPVRDSASGMSASGGRMLEGLGPLHSGMTTVGARSLQFTPDPARQGSDDDDDEDGYKNIGNKAKTCVASVAAEEGDPGQQREPPLLENFPKTPSQQDTGRLWRPRPEEFLRCFLCTAWANSHLAPTEVAVDGRAIVPLFVPDDLEMTPDRNRVGRQTFLDEADCIEDADDWYPPRAAVLVSEFLEAAIARQSPPSSQSARSAGRCGGGGDHTAGVRSSSSSSGSSDALVGVVPLCRADGSGVAVLPRLAGRISVMMIPPRRPPPPLPPRTTRKLEKHISNNPNTDELLSGATEVRTTGGGHNANAGASVDYDVGVTGMAAAGGCRRPAALDRNGDVAVEETGLQQTGKATPTAETTTTITTAAGEAWAAVTVPSTKQVGSSVGSKVVITPSQKIVGRRGATDARSARAFDASPSLPPQSPARPRLTPILPTPTPPAVAATLGPEYTSLVKRSLRHLVVCEGCEIVVPRLVSDDDSEGRDTGPGDEFGPSGDGEVVITAIVRVDAFSTSAGGGNAAGYADRSGVAGALLSPSIAVTTPLNDRACAAESRRACFAHLAVMTAVLEGAFCVIAPESTVFVGSVCATVVRSVTDCLDSTVATTSDGKATATDGGIRDTARMVRPGGLGAWAGEASCGGAEREKDGNGWRDKGGGFPAVKRRLSGRTPTDALMELMLLPMTARPPSQEGLTRLEFLIPRGVLLTGPPGVGKTFAVRSAVEAVRKMSSAGSGQSFQVQLTTLNGAEILSLGQWEACQALKESFSTAERWSREEGEGRAERGGQTTWTGSTTTRDSRFASHTRGSNSNSSSSSSRRGRCAVIFLDEADALLARRDRDGDKAAGGDGARALAQLLTLMDGFHKAEGSHVLVIGATNRPGALDPALRRPGRFDREVALAPPDEETRADILRHHLTAVKIVGGDSTIAATASKCLGYVGADLAALAREAALIAARDPERRVSVDQEAVLRLDDLTAAMEKVGASSLRGHQVTVPKTPWSAIGGMEEAKVQLRQAVEWPVVNKQAFTRMGLTPPRGILLFGPPGCSKTTLVRAAATAAGATFVCLSGADVFSPYLGEAEAAIRQAFLLARNAAPALLFFDEIDAIVCKRDGGGGKGSSASAESRVLATFLTEMDGVGAMKGDGVIVVGATNRPEAVDRALLRPGRFDKVIYAPLPNKDARRQIFEVHTRKMAIDREHVNFQMLADVCDGLTGAEIEGICKEAAMSAIRETGFGDNRSTNNSRILENGNAPNKSNGGTPGNDNTPNNGDSGIMENDQIGRRGNEEGARARGNCHNIPDDTDGWSRNTGNSSGASRRAWRGEGENKQPLLLSMVRMRHLLTAARSAATRPGVSAKMVEGYRLFAAGLR